MSGNLGINPHSASLNYSGQFTFPCKNIRSSSFLDTNKMSFSQIRMEGIRSSQKSNIFYSKVFTCLSEKTTAGGVELESNSARSAVSLRHGQGGYPFPIRKGDHTTSEVKPTKKSAESASIYTAFFIYK